MRGLRPHKEPPPTRAPKIPPLRRSTRDIHVHLELVGRDVFVVDAWCADCEDSYVSVYTTRPAARDDMKEWRFQHAAHETYSGIHKTVVG